MITAEEKGFIDDIISSPKDDSLRLVYADWLDENGQEAKAEFIRVQIEIARLEPGLETIPRHLEQQEYNLLFDHVHLWSGNLPEIFGTPIEAVVQFRSATNWVFLRGLIGSISCTAEEWMNHAEDITKDHPIEIVILETLPNVHDYADRFPELRPEYAQQFRWPVSGSYRNRTARWLRQKWPGIHFIFEFPRNPEYQT